MSQSSLKHMGSKARLALQIDRETRINLHSYTGKKVERTVQAAVDLHPQQEHIEATVKAHQCATCWEELHTDHLIHRFESLRDAKRGQLATKAHKAHKASLKASQIVMDWQEEESQAEAWLEIAIWDCLAEDSTYG